MRARLLRVSILLCAGAQGGVATSQTYHAVELPLLPGGTAASARAINEAGTVVGESNRSLPGYPEAVVWLAEGPFEIGGSGFSGSISMDVNASGQIVGTIDEFPGAFVFDGIALAPLSPDFLFSGAHAVNDSGIVVGSLMQRAVVWQDGHATHLPDLGVDVSLASDINAGGVIVGHAVDESMHTVAVRWTDGRIEVIADAGHHAEAHAVNASGQIVGEMTEFAGPGEFWVTRAFLWTDGSLSELASLGGLTTRTHAINARGDIVGQSAPSFMAPHAVLWRAGQVHDLNDLVVSGARDLELAIAFGINDSGQIVGVTEDNRAFRLDPIPEPGPHGLRVGGARVVGAGIHP